MPYNLVVTGAFGDYQIGDQITDQATVAQVVQTHPERVVKVAMPVTDQNGEH